MTTPTQPAADPQALTALLDRCKTLCENATGVISTLPADKSDFLKDNLGDAVQHLELVLRVLDKETGKTEEPAGFLSRLTRSRSKKEEAAGSKDGKSALPELNICRQGLQGNSWTIPLPELIGFLAYGRKTGVLWVDSQDENFLIGLDEGRLMHATSDRTPEGLRLGEILVGMGYLTRRQLERYLEGHRGQDGQNAAMTGEMLLNSGMINDEELQEALQQQVQQLFHRLIDAENAIFSFREGMQVALAYHVNQNIPRLLLESARVQDELTNNGTLKAIVGELAGSSETAEHVPEDWDTWNREMLTELQRMVLPDENAKGIADQTKEGSKSPDGPVPSAKKDGAGNHQKGNNHGHKGGHGNNKNIKH